MTHLLACACGGTIEILAVFAACMISSIIVALEWLGVGFKKHHKTKEGWSDESAEG
jgi:hypothetical protein